MSDIVEIVSSKILEYHSSGRTTFKSVAVSFLTHTLAKKKKIYQDKYGSSSLLANRQTSKRTKNKVKGKLFLLWFSPSGMKDLKLMRVHCQII